METMHIDPSEKIALKLRKHWIILLRDTSGTLIVGIMPFIIIPAIVATIPSLYFDAIGSAHIATFASALWLLIIWLTLFVIWTDYYLDMWIVTDKRIFNIEQINLFNRRVATWSLERVQEITVKQENMLQEFFGYGSIEIQTAGPTAEYAKIEGIPKPSEVRGVILRQMGRADDKKIKSDTTVDTNS